MFHSYLELFINHNQWMLEGDRTGRSISEFKNYLTVNHGLLDVAKKFGIQKFTLEISIHHCKKPGRRNRSFQMVECSHVRMDFYYLRSVSQQTTNKARYDAICVQAKMSEFYLGLWAPQQTF